MMLQQLGIKNKQKPWNWLQELSTSLFFDDMFIAMSMGVICVKDPKVHAMHDMDYCNQYQTTRAQWKRVSVDFIMKPPKSKGYDSIMMVVDKNTKLAHFIPTKETINSSGTASLYLHNVWKHHGTLDEMILDRGTIFVSKFIRRLCQLLQIQPSPTTTFYLQADGQIERVNQIVEQFLRMFTIKRQDD